MKTPKLLAVGSFVGLLIIGAMFQSQGMPIGGTIAGLTSSSTAITADRTIVGIDGTSAVPTLCFGDTNTCMYRGGISAEDIAFFMGGGTRLVVRQDHLDPGSNNVYDIGNSLRNMRTVYVATSIAVASTDSTGTPGNATINQMCGKSAIAAGASAVTITNSTVAATANIFVNPTELDATCVGGTWIPVAGAGSFVVTATDDNGAAVNCTAATNFDWCVFQ